MTDVHANGRVTHPDRQTLCAAEATHIRLASYLPDDVGEEPHVTNGDDMEAEWSRFVRLGVLTVAWLLLGLLAALGAIAVGSGVLGS
jgi:hypothetical protein